VKRLSIALLLLCGLSLESPLARRYAAAAPLQEVEDDEIEDLRKTLTEVLRARREVEFEFVDRVLLKVKQGALPRSMVVGTFNWARKKPRHPFQYFEYGLRERAKQIGVVL
jgi:hypothetical protein